MTAATTVPDLPILLPGVPVLARRDGCVQIGCDPDTALIVDVDSGVDPRAVAALLHLLRGPADQPTVTRRLRAIGLSVRSFRAILDMLVATGRAAPLRPPAGQAVTVHILGRGDAARALAESLTAADVPVDDVPAPGLVVLADQPVADPQLVRDLTVAGVPHMPVHLRDGIGVVGPLVLPGTSSCLRCVDLHRTDLDPQWPIVAASLLDLVGQADPAVLRATVAIAHAQIDEMTSRLAAPATTPPSLVGRVLEFRTGPSRIDSRSAPVHARCGCTSTGRRTA